MARSIITHSVTVEFKKILFNNQLDDFSLAVPTSTS